jgi:hypothetical protein
MKNVKRPPHRYVDRATERFQIARHKRLSSGKCGVSNRNVDPPEFVYYVIHEPLDGPLVGNIPRTQQRAPSCRAYLRCNLLGFICIRMVIDRHIGTVLCQGFGNRPTDATTCACHQCNLSG